MENNIGTGITAIIVIRENENFMVQSRLDYPTKDLFAMDKEQLGTVLQNHLEDIKRQLAPSTNKDIVGNEPNGNFISKQEQETN